MKKRLILVLLIAALLLLASCKKAECDVDADCQRTGYTAECVDGTCQRDIIPGVCGNLACEPEAGESPANCEIDCGGCEGSTGKYLEWMAINGECLEGIEKQKPVIMTDELKTGGDTFRVTTRYNEPFNLRKDVFTVTISLAVQGSYNRNEVIKSITLTGTTPAKRTITLAEKSLNRPVFKGADVKEDLRIDFPAAEREGEFTSLTLKITYDYSVRSGTRIIPKTGVMQNKYRTVKSFPWANPGVTYPCPASCDDNNPGTQDTCIDGFCVHQPIPNACGNFICDAGFESKCSCPSDCGPCAGPAGSYTNFACVGVSCVARLNPGVAVTPKSLFDDRNLNIFHLQNTYNYNQPFNTAKDKIEINFNLYNRQEGVTAIRISSVRLLEGTNVIATNDKAVSLASIGSKGKLDIVVPAQPVPEIDKSVSLRVDYEYTKGGDKKKSQYTKSLGKITFISPG